MEASLHHGLRLTKPEYERQIVELHSQLPPAPSQDMDRMVRRRELDLAIDHRLGQSFPEERRNALWAIQEQVERKRLRLVFMYLLKSLIGRRPVRDALNLAGYLVDQYATVLNEAELEAFFGKDESHSPSLPIDERRD